VEWNGYFEPQSELEGESEVEEDMGEFQGAAESVGSAPGTAGNATYCKEHQIAEDSHAKTETAALRSIMEMVSHLTERFEKLETSVSSNLETVQARMTIVEGRLRFLEEKSSPPPTTHGAGIQITNATEQPKEPKQISCEIEKSEPANTSATTELIARMHERFRETHDLLRVTNISNQASQSA